MIKFSFRVIALFGLSGMLLTGCTEYNLLRKATAAPSDAILLGRVARFDGGTPGKWYHKQENSFTQCVVLKMKGITRTSIDMKTGLYAIRWPGGEPLKAKLLLACTFMSGFAVKSAVAHVVVEYDLLPKAGTIYLAPLRNFYFSDWKSTGAIRHSDDRSRQSGETILSEFRERLPQYSNFTNVERLE